MYVFNLQGLHHPRPLSAVNHGFMNRMYPNKLYGQYGNTIRSDMGFGYHGYDSRAGGRTWLAVDGKFKPRGRSGGYYCYGNENMDGLNELNRGPRAKGSKSQKDFVPTTLAVKGQNLPINAANEKEKDKTTAVPDREQYNKADFPEEYADAKFFIIKSYSEDDVHKSIKYNVWASTPNGNKKLHAAYQEAQEKSGGCPVFLFFSVSISDVLLCGIYCCYYAYLICIFLCRLIPAGNLWVLLRWWGRLTSTRTLSTGNKTSGMAISLLSGISSKMYPTVC